MANKKSKFGFLLAALLSLLPPAHAGVDESWTDSLHLKEGTYAARIDPAARAITVLRADDRAGRGFLRVKLGATTILLHAIAGEHAPWRYAGSAAVVDEKVTSVELEASDDGQRWRRLGTFHHP